MKRHIIVAEDELTIRMIYSTYLSGYDVSEAENAAQALGLYERLTDETGSLPVLVTDNRMGPGPTGVELCVELAQRYDGFMEKGIIISGDRPEQLRSDLSDKGIEGIDILVKPVDRDILINTVGRKFDDNTVYRPEDHSILVVDDEEYVRALSQTVLEKLGYRVSACENAVQGLEQLRSDNKFTLVLSDVVMLPMNGIEFYKHAPERYKNRWLFMTGSHFNDPFVKSIGYIAKPFRLAQLHEAVKNKIMGIESPYSSASQQQEQH